MLPSFASQRVTVLNPGSRVEWGQEIEDWGHPVETECVCVWYALSGVETIGARDVAAGARQVFFEPGAPVTASSRLRFPDGGRDWEVIGEPGPQASPLGGASNLEVLVKRWEGDQ